jgi:tetratricopeptide (TPR) repeat protein
VLSEILQLPEIDAVLHRILPVETTLENLHRAEDIFSKFQAGGREHVAVQSLLAETQQRHGRYEEARRTLEKIHSEQKDGSRLLQDDLTLAKAKLCWTHGDFEEAQALCDTIISTYNDFEETFGAATHLHVASAMTGKALGGLAAMQTLQDAYSVRDYFRVAQKFLERHPSSSNAPMAAAQLNVGLAEAIYNLFVRQIHGGVGDVHDIPMDAAMKAWFQGLQKLKKDAAAIANQQYLTAALQTNLAWGVLNFEQDRNDSLQKASDYAKKALSIYDANESRIGKEGMVRVLTVVADCYVRADSAVTAEGLYQSAIDKTNNTSPLQSKLQKQQAFLQYSQLCQNWEKRCGDAKKLLETAKELEAALPSKWQLPKDRDYAGRTHPGLYGSLWFWTPGEMQC